MVMIKTVQTLVKKFQSHMMIQMVLMLMAMAGVVKVTEANYENRI
jgi:hypothetical protein